MDLTARLRERRDEIEQAMLARVHAVSDPSEVEDPEYAIGLKEAVAAALDYSVAGIENEDPEHAPVPDRLLAQARAAARNRVPLDTVLRRYSTGYSLLDDYLIRASEEGGSASGEELKRALRFLSAVFDRLVAAVSSEYASERERNHRSAARRSAERVRKLLAGDPVDSAELHYELDAWHLAVVASGPGAVEAIRDLAPALDRNLLLVQPDGEASWAWLGGRSRLSTREALRLAEQSLSDELSFAFGEPGQGVEGWRLSHRQARAAMSVARRGRERRVRYADVALLASALGDDVLASSLHELYLAPLEGERDGGAALRRTLRAYFAAGRNVSSAAATLGITRQTVSAHLRAIEERIEDSLDNCTAETETALRLRELNGHY
jgi:DNA-binding transcriptional ArsR family regulator